MTTKKCPKCRRSKPLDQFYNNRKQVDGKQTYCKKCHSVNVRAWQTKNKLRLRTYTRNWQKKNKDKMRVARRRHDLKKKYGLTSEDFDALLQKYKGKCHICKKCPGKLCVDHCHRTKKIRG